MAFGDVLYNKEIGKEKIIQKFQFFLISIIIHLAALAIFGAIVLENTFQVREVVVVQMLKNPKETQKIRENFLKTHNYAILERQTPDMIKYAPQKLINPIDINAHNNTDIIPVYQYDLPNTKPAIASPKLEPIKPVIPTPKAVVTTSKPKPYVSQENVFSLRQTFETATQKPSLSFHSLDDSGSKVILRNFLELVSHRIDKAKRYPSWALDAGIQGRIIIRFTILKDGTLEHELQVVKSSGAEILDNAAIAAIRAAAPFPAIPPSLGREKLKIELPLDFKLTES